MHHDPQSCCVLEGYTIETLNRNENNQPALEVAYVILGEQAEEVEVKPELKKKGVQLRQYSPDHFYESRNLLSYLWIKYPLITVPATYILITLALSWVCEKFGRWRLIKKQEEYVCSIKNQLSKPGELDKLRQQSNLGVIAEYILKANQEVRSQKQNKKILQLLRDKLSEPGELDKLQSEPLVAAKYIVSTYREVSSKTIPKWLRCFFQNSEP